MQCSVCGSQSTTFKQGISKSGKNAGKPWRAYDCNEPQCKNEKGYPNRTFAPSPRNGTQSPQAPLGEMKTIIAKLDLIINALTKKGLMPKTEVLHEEISGLDEGSEETPF